MKNFFYLLLIILPLTLSAQELKWKKFGDLQTPRNHASVAKIGEYETLVIGGLTNSGTPLLTCEIINIKDSTIKSGPNLKVATGWNSTITHKNGNIYVTGGFYSYWENTITSIQMFDVTTKTWKLLGNLIIGRAMHSSIFLNDSLLLIVGGEIGGQASTSTCEIFNINTNKSSMTSNLPIASNSHILGMLPTGDIICTGVREGRINTNRNNLIYKFDKINEKWDVLNTTINKLNNPAGLQLDDGNFIFSGGIEMENPLSILKSNYVSNNNQIVYLNDMLSERNWHCLAQFNSDSVIVIGGYNSLDINIDYCEWIDLNTMTVTKGPKLINPRRAHNVISLKNPRHNKSNSILTLCGGNFLYSTSLSSVEILQDETIYKNNPPVITEKVKSCNEYKLTIESEGGFKSFNLIDSLSFNITMGSWEFINPTKAIFKLKLIDQSKFGKFSLKITNSTGLITIFIDSINNKGFNIINEHNTTTNINAYPKQDTIVLTTNNYYYRGSAWLNEKQIISQEFSMNFSFLYRDGINSNCDDHSELGADGIALVFQNSNNTVCGAYGGGIGYASLNNALALEFDTFRNDSTQIIDYNDPNGNHFAIQHSKGTISPLHDKDNTLLLNSKIPLLTNGTVYNVNIDYNVEPNTLRVFLDSAGQNNREIANLKNFKFEDYINLDNGKAYIGFTSSTGCATAIHEIFNWNLCSTRITEVEDEPTTNISIYPNPAEDNITFLTDNNISKFEIFNYIGENMPISLISDYNNQIGKITVDISKLNPGLYFIKMGNKYTKFIKK